MVCVKSKFGSTVRVTRERAATMVATGDWQYANRFDWKADGRKYL
jgi:hypothetical protein